MVCFLKKLPITVNRQKIIGRYIIDFYIASKSIAIEIDGAQHRMPEQKEADEKRERELLMLGIKVLRYTNKEINKSFNAVCEDILKNIGIAYSDLKKL